MTEIERERQVLALMDRALELPSGERADFVVKATQGDGALRRRVLSLLDIDGVSGHMLRTGGAAGALGEDAMPERAGLYRIVRLIGRGGMGAVFEGKRDAGDFEHRVAVKVIRSTGFDRAMVDRFHRERQILARLNHPNIARLFDGGALLDGSPYFVMEYVDGQPVTDWAEQQGLDLRARLDLFRDICAAVHHVHQALVIHRDITPTNVLVTRDGMVKLIDFGIAKPDEAEPPGETDTQTDSRSYTPGYAAPERMSGAGATVLSDVFSLGRLLEELAGPLPEKSDLREIIRMATMKSPSDRYSSVDALSEDVLAFLKRRPVRAVKGGWKYAAAKYFERHPLASVSAALAVTGLAGGLILTTSLYQQAEAERLAANQRYNEVRELARFMIFDLYDELVKVTGNTRATEMIADKSLTYLESLKRDPRAPMEVALETSAGYQRLADVLGNPTAPNLGERATATSLLDESIQGLEALYLRYPDDRRVMQRLAEANFSGATHAYVADDNNEKARALALRASEIYQALSARPDATMDDQRNVLRARLMAAVPLPWVGRAQEGVTELKQVRQQAGALLERYPDNADIEQFFGSVNVELARAVIRERTSSGGDESTLPYWDEAVGVRERAYARNPEDMRPYRTLAIILYERGAERRGFQQYDGALEDMQRAAGIVDELLHLDPDDFSLMRTKGGILEETAKTLAYAGRTEEAVALVPSALELSIAEIEQYPDNAGLQREFAFSLTLYADIYAKAGLTAERCAMAADAASAWERAAQTQPLSELDLASSQRDLDALQAGCPD